jgi:alpha-L-rhamnosidase
MRYGGNRMRAIHLKTEYLVNQIGIDMTTPRLFWNCEDGITQSAYQIVAIDESKETVWDTGKVQSSLMTHIPYQGKTLCSRE